MKRSWLLLALTLFVLAAIQFAFPSSYARDLTFEERVRAQEATERVYYSHQIGATKPFEEAVPRAVLEEKVRKYLKQTVALEEYWATPVTAEMLEREVERMVRETRMPERLRELFAALGDDPFLVQECLARQTLVSRLAHNFFAFDSQIHEEGRGRAEDVLEELSSGKLDLAWDHPARNVVAFVREHPSPRGVVNEEDGVRIIGLGPEEFDKLEQRNGKPGEIGPLIEERDAFVVRVVLEEEADRLLVATYTFLKRSWDEWWHEADSWFDGNLASEVAEENASVPHIPASQGESCNPEGAWDNGILDDVPDARSGPALWTGSLMIIWGGHPGVNTGGRYDPATDTWTPTSMVGVPQGRWRHTAVWTGERMVVWGGRPSNQSTAVVDTGGRYDPVTDSWEPTSTVGAPIPRSQHTAVWSGQTMIVWGGSDSSGALASGGRYDPVADTWEPTLIFGAPRARVLHTAVWTGSLMIIWGGLFETNTGALYDPTTDIWTPIATLGAPDARVYHTAVWAGTHMIVWGGKLTPDIVNTGGRYDPVTNTWEPTSLSGAPSPRIDHSAVWAGGRMIVWGGVGPGPEELDTGGRYDPVTDSWTPTSTANAPTARDDHTAVWTGDLMIVWGGWSITGGRYDPVTDSWTPTSTGGTPPPRWGHTAVWTGSLMIVWGGASGGVSAIELDTGGRYDPATQTWTPTSTAGAPVGRYRHTTVWTGDRMVVWGGFPERDTGGRYDPVADAWAPTSTVGVPEGRQDHSAVWSGERMIVWGGNLGLLDTGGRYDPVADTWEPTTTTGAPHARHLHTAIWSGERMIVWGGDYYDGVHNYLNSGGLYDPVTDTWAPTSTTDAPPEGSNSTVVWTGERMIVWGGFTFDGQIHYSDTGGRYDPVTDTWTPTSTTAVPSMRTSHTAVWTGSIMIVWGGAGDEILDTGGRYDTVTDTWASTSTTDAPPKRSNHTAVWTGDLMIVWGGKDIVEYNSGSHYSPGIDADCDGVVDGEDCAVLDPGSFAVPAEVTNLLLAGDKITLSWDSAIPGAGDGTVHDVAAGSTGEFPVGSGLVEICAAPGVSEATTSQSAEPASGSGTWYLVRGRNLCGAGTYGFESDGPERMTGVCP